MSASDTHSLVFGRSTLAKHTGWWKSHRAAIILSSKDRGSTCMATHIPGNSIAFVIGINAYGNGVPALRSAVADARRLAEMLRNGHGYDVVLLDDPVTLSKIRGGLTDVLPAKVRNPDDRLLVYFAGHGISLDDDDVAGGVTCCPRTQSGMTPPPSSRWPNSRRHWTASRVDTCW